MLLTLLTNGEIRYSHLVENYTEKEFLDSFTRAFRDGKADYITFDGHVARSRFLREATQWGLDNNIIYEDVDMSTLYSDSQWTVQIFRLTDAGRAKIFSRLDPQIEDHTSALDVMIDV